MNLFSFRQLLAISLATGCFLFAYGQDKNSFDYPLNIPDTGVSTTLTTAELPKPLKYGWDNRYLTNHLPQRYNSLPAPEATKQKAKTLSIHEALMLALRYSSTIANSDISLVTSKFSHETTQSHLYPQISDLDVSFSSSEGTSTTSLGTTTASLKTRYGGEYSVSYSNTGLGSGGTSTYSFNLTQPLLRGLGKVADLPYIQSDRNYKIALMTYKSNVISLVDSVTTGYWGLIESELSYKNTLHSYNDTKDSVRRSRLEYKAGQSSKSTLIEAEASLASTKNQVVSQLQSLQQTYTSYLQTIGLNIYSNISIDTTIVDKKVKLPTLKECIERALKNNISYQTTLMQLQTSQEAILSARDARLWQVNLTAGYSNTLTSSTGTVSTTQHPLSVGLSLDIPINDIDSQNSLIAARAAYEEAKITAQNDKLTLIRNVTQTYRNIKTSYEAVGIAKRSVKLSQEVLNNAKLQLRYGQTTMFEVNTDRTSLLSAQNTLVSNQVSYLKNVQSLYDYMSDTLDFWHITLKDLPDVLR